MVSLSFTSVRGMANLFGRANNVSERRVTAVKSRGAWGANYEKLFFTHLIFSLFACSPNKTTNYESQNFSGVERKPGKF